MKPQFYYIKVGFNRVRLYRYDFVMYFFSCASFNVESVLSVTGEHKANLMDTLESFAAILKRVTI